MREVWEGWTVQKASESPSNLAEVDRLYFGQRLACAMNISYYKKLVGVVNGNSYGCGVEHVSNWRKTVVELT